MDNKLYERDKSSKEEDETDHASIESRPTMNKVDNMGKWK